MRLLSNCALYCFVGIAGYRKELVSIFVMIYILLIIQKRRIFQKLKEWHRFFINFSYLEGAKKHEKIVILRKEVYVV